jgi:hypothetical protein
MKGCVLPGYELTCEFLYLHLSQKCRSHEYQVVLIVLTVKHTSWVDRCVMSSGILFTEFQNESVVGVYSVK